MPWRPRVVLTIAAAGYGKSTALEVAAPRDGLVCSAREALAAAQTLHRYPWLGIDDLHELDAAEQRRLLTALSGLPSDRQLMLTSSRPLAPDVRAQGFGAVQDRGPDELALDPYAVHRVLADEYGLADPELPVTLHRLTSGWPALVHLAAGVMASRRSADPHLALTAADAPAPEWLWREVLDPLSTGTRTVLSCLADLGPTTERTGAAVARSLGCEPQEWDSAELVATGVLRRLGGIGRDGLVQPVPVVAEAARASLRPPDVALAAACRGLIEDGLPYGAARAAAGAGDWATARRLLSQRGDDMVRHGHAAGVVELVTSAPHGGLTDEVRRVHALALCTSGDVSGAARAYRPLVCAADDPCGAGWSAALACGVAMLAYARGDLEQALATLARVAAPRAEDHTAGTVELLSWRAHVLCSLGRRDEAVAVAADALVRAEASGEPVALAAGHLAAARVSRSQRKQAHHELALRALHASGDVVTAARALVNHSCQLLADARYDAAEQTAREAVRAADTGIAAGRRASALHNLAEALLHRGAFDEAAWHLERAIALCRRLGDGRIALGVLGLAEVCRHLGRDQQARARYLEAATLAREAGEPQVLVPALAGLARLPDPDGVPSVDPAHAADEACGAATGWLRPVAWTAAGWVALRRGDRAEASRLAGRAVAVAREEDAFDLLADALELAAACADRADDARRLLTEALSVWQAGGARPRMHRVELLLARLEGADSTARSRGRAAARELQQLGVTHVHGQPVSTGFGGAPVSVEVLGGFRVLIDGAAVPVTAWRSRQARTLVKLLAARHGRPATRAWLCETLWPDDDPARTGHRLSVLLATVRTVLDPERSWPTDRFVAADLGGVWLDPTYVTVDADLLVRDAQVAAELMDAGETDRAQEILSEVNERYRGDAFEDDPAEEWADGPREEVRAAWQRSVRRLAALARRAGRVGDAQTLLIRLLTADPYDENVHELLVRSMLAAGRRGEAHRAFQRWSAAMRDIGAPPPSPAILQARPPHPRRAGRVPGSAALTSY